MKNILSFDKYYIIKENDGLVPPDAPDLQTPAGEEKESDYETPKRSAVVLLKKLMNELRSHLIYWFRYGKMSKLLTSDADDVTLEKRGLCLWATDTNGSDDTKYQWRIKLSEAEQEGMVERVEKIRISLDVFDYSRQYLVRSDEAIITVGKFTEEFLISRIKRMKSTIIKVPTDNNDVEKFKDEEEGLLGDDIY
jgi:hypothetical protein